MVVLPPDDEESKVRAINLTDIHVTGCVLHVRSSQITSKHAPAVVVVLATLDDAPEGCVASAVDDAPGGCVASAKHTIKLS